MSTNRGTKTPGLVECLILFYIALESLKFRVTASAQFLTAPSGIYFSSLVVEKVSRDSHMLYWMQEANCTRFIYGHGLEDVLLKHGPKCQTGGLS